MLTLIEQYASRPQTAVSLFQMLQYGSTLSTEMLFHGSMFLRTELPIRLAHRVMDLEQLPEGLKGAPSIKLVKELYSSSFDELLRLPVCKGTTHENMAEFNKKLVDVLEWIKTRHQNVVQLMARGIIEGKQNGQVTRFLEQFYLSRIGIRCLIGHHLALYKQSLDCKKDPDWVGIVCKKTNVLKVAKHAVDDALNIFENHYGPFSAPVITYHCPTPGKTPTLSYIPSHLHHMLFELVKNSLRATADHHDSLAQKPPIRIIVAEGSEGITVKISDEGGGMPKAQADKLIWSFSFTTAQLDHEGSFEQTLEQRAPLAGYGYGLPLSRLYAKYFGGDLRVIAMEGFGTDAYLTLKRLSDSREPLIN